ncbi:MAG: UDP-N-acetylmuramate dehydrogenase, partial [Bacteroidota bacterium]
ENLALIPGQCGAAPIQNIGAYGRELESVLEYVDGMDLRTGEQMRISRQECRFGYRDSIFKHDFEKKFFISSITLRLTVENHLITDEYDALKKELVAQKINHATIQDIYNTVVNIRRSKLPDPSVTGNAGSFFKNPIIPAAHGAALKLNHPTIPLYTIDNQYVKVPAGWLIEQAGWKGKQLGRVGVHDRQALVLVNLGGATGLEIFDFSSLIIDDILKKFGIQLEREVNII